MKKLAPTSYVLAFFCLFLLFPSPVRAMEGYSSLPPSFAGIASLILWILLTSAIKFGISFLSLPLDKKARLVFAAATLGIQTFQFVLLYFESGRFASPLSFSLFLFFGYLLQLIPEGALLCVACSPAQRPPSLRKTFLHAIFSNIAVILVVRLLLCVTQPPGSPIFF